MLPGRRADNGSLFIRESAPTQIELVGGIAISELGVLYVTSTLPPQVFVNGFGVRHDGQLCVAFGGTIDYFEMGLPFTADGRLVCQLNQTMQPYEPYVGGIRVGPLGGVYAVDIAPPKQFGYSNGFSTGFNTEAAV